MPHCCVKDDNANDSPNIVLNNDGSMAVTLFEAKYYAIYHKM